LKLVTWNINSIRARQERVLAWVDANAPDVLCLQELKVTDEAFPVDDFHSRGYEVALAGQKTYNGVAILSRKPIADVTRGLADDADDPQARLIGGTIDGVRVLSVYAPNGGVVGGDKWDYKLRWLARLRGYLDRHCDPAHPLVVCGDYNVAPEPRDVHDPARWERQVLYHPDARAALKRVCGFGLRDAYRIHHDEPGRYTWWDYRELSFPRDYGLRIDHALVTAPLAERCRAADIDREARKGKQPSDHAPVVLTFDA
jgi:exodeoxyribonuclease-3